MEAGRIIAAAFITVLAAVWVAAPPARGAVNCARVNVALMPCLDYLRGRGYNPPTRCCDGVRTVKGIADSTPYGKRDTCNCVRAAAGRLTDLKDEAARALATKCGVQLSIPVSRNVDCSRFE